MTQVHKMLPRVSAHVVNDVEHISKEKIIVEGGAYVSGTVLGKLDNGNYTQLDITADATQGHEADVILYGHVDATVEPVNATAHARVTAVYDANLTWPEGITAEKKTAAVAKLNAKHIILR